MTVEVANVVGHSNGDTKTNPNAVSRKSKENERCRRRRKQKKNNKVSSHGEDSDTAAISAAADANGVADENSDFQKSLEQVEVEYVPEKAELDGELDEEFRKVFEKFCFVDATGSEENDKMDESAADAALKKKAYSDSEEEQDAQPKEKGISNKKKKLQRRMKIAELKQVSTRPDVVEFGYPANFSA